MPKPTYPRDRFDDLPDDGDRVGAHRAENPRLRGGVVFLWAAVATIVLVVAGIFGSLLVSGRISLAPEETPTSIPVPEVEGVIDTSYSVVVLNATTEAGLATGVKDQLVAAGWPADNVLASDAATTGFETTSVYYVHAEDEAAAIGVADAIGGAEVVQSDAYAYADDPETEEDESLAKELTVVLGMDRVAPVETPAATP